LAVLDALPVASATWRGYLAIATMTVAALSLGTILLTVAVDPYRMYGTPTIPSLTEMKPLAYRHSDFVKEYLLERMRPRTLLLGNSRVEIGLDPESPLWPADDRPVFNAAESGRDLAIALVRLRHAMEIAPPRVVVVAMDFPDFLEPGDIRSNREPEREATRLPLNQEGRPNMQRDIQLWKDRLATTLTIDAVIDSFATMIDQDPRRAVTMTDAGFNPHHEFDVIARREGYHALFAQKYDAYAAQYAAYARPDFDEPLRHANFRYVDRMVRLAVAHGTHIIFYINPYHCSLLNLWHEDGLWPGFESWKQALVSVVDRAAGPASGLATILDFSGYSRYAMEPFPNADDRSTTMRWYWEPGHYKSALGEKLIARMVGDNEAYGQVLTATTIDQNLQTGAKGYREASTEQSCR
jgi:hypothetical protein